MQQSSIAPFSSSTDEVDHSFFIVFKDTHNGTELKAKVWNPFAQSFTSEACK